MTDGFLQSRAWLELRERIRDRDTNRCTVGRLLGGRCRGVLHVNHIIPRSERPDLALDPDNCGTACASHHPMWEAVVRTLRALDGELPPCGHRHPYPQGREECDRKRRRQMIERRVSKLARVA